LYKVFVRGPCDPAGTVTRQEFDDAGRRVALVENKIAGTAADKNRTTRFEYNSDGLLTALVAENATTGDQTTRYVYGTLVGSSTPAVCRNDLLRAVIYPDGDDTHSGGYTGSLGNGTDNTYDRVEYVYNRQGQVAELTDQNGTVHAYEYDLAGRRMADKVSAFGSAIDQTVQRIDVAFADRGGLARVSSRSGTSGSSTVVNEVARSYNAFGQLFQEKQDHAAAVGTGTPLVGYLLPFTGANPGKHGFF
jgi:YD repeat-containing protein